MTLKNFAALLFPYRAHLEAEIEYLKAQLAQAQRRLDEHLSVKPIPSKVQFERKPDGKLVAAQPKGWDAYRAAQRLKPAPEPEEENKNAASQ